MTETEISCEPFPRPASPLWTCSTKFTYGILALIVSFLVKVLIDYRDNIIISWGNILFLVLYTIFLFLIFIVVSQNQLGSFSNPESSYLRRLVRVRSRLTFLPITHFIRQQNTTEKVKGKDDSCDEQSNNDAKTELSTRIEEQRDILIDTILQGYVFPWYNRISDEETFPSHFKNVLKSVCTRFHEKILQVDRTTLAKEAIQLIHCHWKEYCEVVREGCTDETIVKNFKLSHSFVENKSEISKHYERLVCLVLRELVIPDLQSNLLCQFLSGILVKCFVLYYVDLLSQPKWINTSLVCLISSGGLEMSHSSQNCTLPETPVSTCSSSIFASEDSIIKVTSSSPTLEDRPAQWGNEKSTPSPQMTDFFNDELQVHSRNITPSDDSSLNEAQLPGCSLLDNFSPVHQLLELALKNGHENETMVIASSTTHEFKDTTEKRIESDETEKTVRGTDSLENFKDSKIVLEKPPALNSKLNDKELDIKKNGKNKVNQTKSNPLFGSVSTALSGLLNTAAMPLLPEGCHGSLDDLTSKVKGHVYTPSPLRRDLSSITLTASSELKVGEEIKRRLSAGDTPSKREPGKDMDNLFSSDWKEHTKVNSRHYSFDESSKVKANYNLETKSLDESRSQTVLRQEEFDYGTNKDPDNMLRANNLQSNISPMYEEPEDFAATIAKLRSLLEQRESQKNLMANTDMDGAQEASTSKIVSEQRCPSPKGTAPKTRPSLNSQSSASSLGSDGSGSSIMQLSTDIDKMEKIVDELEEPVHIHRLFTNVTVSKAESLNDSGDQFTLYCIQYEGVYPDEDDEEQVGKIVLRTTTVKRRFKEFLLLQSHLEENKMFKPHLKGIKAPNKWLNLSFSKVDTAVLNQRKTLLEKYIQQLCYHPILGFCSELRQFMAYGEEGFHAFCLSDGGGNVHRFDKLAKKFTGVINSLRDVLPTFDSDSISVPSSPDGGWKSPGDSKGSKLFSSFLQFGEKIPPEEIKTVITASTPESKADEILEPDWELRSDDTFSIDKELSAEEKIANYSTAKSVSEESVPEETNATVYPLAAAVTQLLCDVLWLPDHRPHTASVGAFMSISGKSLENYVQETLDVFLSEEAFLGYLEMFATVMKAWNDSAMSLEEQTGYYTEADLKNCLKKKIPVWVRWMWGRHRLDMTIERMAGFCQNSVINHDLLLSLIELTFSKIVDTKESQLDNLSRK